VAHRPPGDLRSVAVPEHRRESITALRRPAPAPARLPGGPRVLRTAPGRGGWQILAKYGIPATLAERERELGKLKRILMARVRDAGTAVTSRYLDHLTNAHAVTALEGVSLLPLED
jgi:hypothetical protein